MRLVNLFDQWSRREVLLFCFCISLFIGMLRFYTGSEYALSLFYLFPITLSAWNVHFKAGLFISLISALSWLTADLSMIGHFSEPFIPFINETFRLIVFIFMSYLVSELRKAGEIQKELARTDPLTGLLNRRAFFEYMDIEWNKAQRFGYHISVIYMDVDNFKTVNDIFGHNGGDKLLCSIATIIKSNIRIIDVAARFGGDEFAILLPQTGSDDSCRVASKIQNKLFSSSPAGQWRPSVSIGIATYECMPRSVKEMIHTADLLMYAAKQDGKNTIRHQVMRDDRAI